MSAGIISLVVSIAGSLAAIWLKWFLGARRNDALRKKDDAERNAAALQVALLDERRRAKKTEEAVEELARGVSDARAGELLSRPLPGKDRRP